MINYFCPILQSGDVHRGSQGEVHHQSIDWCWVMGPVKKLGLLMCGWRHINYFPCSTFTSYNQHVIIFCIYILSQPPCYHFYIYSRFFQLHMSLPIFPPFLVLFFFPWNFILCPWLVYSVYIAVIVLSSDDHVLKVISVFSQQRMQGFL